MKMPHQLPACIIFCTATAGWAQETDPGYDTSYITSFRDKFIITAVSSLNTNEFSITDNDGDDISYSTNLPMSFGIGIDYKWLTLEYTSSFGASGPEEYGDTKSSSLSFGLTMRKFWFRNIYNRTEGYYLTNPEYFNPFFNAETDSYPTRPDLKTSLYLATLNYGFNYRRYSNMASLWQLERQKKSAGSFTTGLAFAYSTFDADSAVVRAKDGNVFEDEAFVKGYFFSMYGLNIGYLYTFALGKKKKWFISLALIPGLSIQSGKAVYNDNTTSGYKLLGGAHGEARLVVGWNGDNWYTTFSSVGYAITNQFSGKNSITQTSSFVRFVVGYKIHMPETKSKFLKKIGL